MSQKHILHRHNHFSLVTSLSLAFLLVCLPLVTAMTVRAADMTASSILDLVNADRTSSGLKPLKLNDQLTAAAEAKLADMLKRGYFSHTSPKGDTPWHWIKLAGYDYQYAGENLAINYSSAQAQHAAWMKSPTHRANILNAKYQETGIAVKSGKLNGATVTITVEFFGGPRNTLFTLSPRAAEASETVVGTQPADTTNIVVPIETVVPASSEKHEIYTKPGGVWGKRLQQLLLPEQSPKDWGWLTVLGTIMMALVAALIPGLFLYESFKAIFHLWRSGHHHLLYESLPLPPPATFSQSKRPVVT